ncbi:MAG: class I SAM-dependent methyltransferase [Candidatus Tectomicrobia bacterium]|nr:class I SAM-dependent methyltransferase [Candidatus Tectomicrobia bacterium]
MSEHAQTIDTTAAEAYEHYLVPSLFGLWAPDVVELANLRAGDHVLDVACGTGTATRLAAAYVTTAGRVVGLDLDPGMLEVARALPASVGAAVEWRRGNALELPFDDNTFDAVLCLQGLQFFPDRVAGLAEMRRVLKSTGRLAVSVWSSLEYCKGHDALARALERQQVDAGAVRRPFSLGDAEELRAIVFEVGFRDVELRTVTKLARFASPKHFVDSIAAGAPSSRHALTQVPEQAQSMLVEDVSATLQPYLDEDGVAIPVESHLLRAQP